MRTRLTIKNPRSQIENDKTPVAEYPNENDSEDTETNKTSATPNFMPKILPDDQIAEGMNSLNSEQREVFNVVLTGAEDYVKYDRHDVEPVLIFLSGGGGTGKCHLMKVIYNSISKTLLYQCKDPKKPRVFLLGPTGMSSLNIVGTTIYSGILK